MHLSASCNDVVLYMNGMEKTFLYIICDIICKVSIHVAIVIHCCWVRSEFLLSFVYVSRPTVHCKELLLSGPKAWLVPQVW